MKRSSQATGHDPTPTRKAPAGGLAQPDERDETVQDEASIDRKALGPRQIIEQAARDTTRGLQDTDLHGTPNKVPGPAPQPGTEPMVSSGGNRRSYAKDQCSGKSAPPERTAPPKTR